MIDSKLIHANILLVDDQQANLDVLSCLLDLEGYTNYLATTDPRRVEALYNEYKPDILLLDLNMPYLNGFQVMKQLSALIPHNKYFPILVLTADISAESKLSALAAGAVDFITKPFDLIEVDLRIKNLLRVGYLHQQLENQNQILEERVKERTSELEKTNISLIAAKEKAEEMNRLKINFLSNMSHELRTPLIGINGFADFLHQDIIDPEQKEMAETIFSCGNRLLETINLILDLSKFESETVELNFQEVDLVKGTEDVLEMFKESARKKSLYLKAFYSQPSICISTDTWAFRSILNHLLNNAIKYTKEGYISVEVSVKNSLVEIKVSDTGIGIAEEFHKIVFEEFRQVSEGLSRNFEGAGLGLNITKRLIDKLGGNITIENRVGGGTTFVVTLPIMNKSCTLENQVAQGNGYQKKSEAQRPIKPVALLVDDDTFVRLILKRFINGELELESTTDGESAIYLCTQKQYRLIFMDINLRGGKDGKEVTRIIRRIKGYEKTPIIASTAYSSTENKEEYLSAGCSHFLHKPFKNSDVTNLLAEILAV